MVAFFGRRLIGGVATWFVATFLFYTLLVSLSIPMQQQICEDCSHQELFIDKERPIVTYVFDKPWPTNYLTWLINPEGITGQTYTFPSELAQAGRIHSATFTLTHSSLLFGDFGNSWKLARGTSALALYGLDLNLFPLVLAILLGFMLIAVLQRRHRPHPYRSSRIPANARWRPAELWATS